MLNFKLGLEDGRVYMNNQLLSFESEKDFLDSIPDNIELENMTYNEYNKYFSEIYFLSEKFYILFTFFEDSLYYNKIGLIWHSGNAYNKAYDVSEKEIKQDICCLAELLKNNYKIKSSSSDLNEERFIYDWGEIVCGGSLVTPSASITISYD